MDEDLNWSGGLDAGESGGRGRGGPSQGGSGNGVERAMMRMTEGDLVEGAAGEASEQRREPDLDEGQKRARERYRDGKKKARTIGQWTEEGENGSSVPYLPMATDLTCTR